MGRAGAALPPARQSREAQLEIPDKRVYITVSS